MRTMLHVFAGAIVALLVSGTASGQQADVFAALLAEVRQIRAAMDRAAGVNPRIQIALHRLDNQQEQVSRLSAQVEGERVKLQQLQMEINGAERELTQVEETLNREGDLQKRTILDQRRSQLKGLLEHRVIETQHARQREAELSSQLHAAQLLWNEQNAQLDALVRALPPP